MPLVRAHPHAEATYQVIPSEDGSFAAEVRSPDTQPTKVGLSKPLPMPRRGLRSTEPEAKRNLRPAAEFGNMRWAKKRQRQ